MSGSITLDMPSMRGVLTMAVGILAVGVLLIAGVAIGIRLLAPDPISALAASSATQQIRVTSGAVYVGRIESVDGEQVRIADAAVIRQEATVSASPGTQLIVELLVIEPYDTTGVLVIPISAIEWVTQVRPGSGLDAAYREATGARAAPGESSTP